MTKKESWLYKTIHTVSKGDLRDFPRVILFCAVFALSTDLEPKSYVVGSLLPTKRLVKTQRKWCPTPH